MDHSSFIRILLFAATVIGLTAAGPLTGKHCSPDEDGIHLAETLGRRCVLLEEPRHDGRAYHYIFCSHVTYQELQEAFAEYRSRPCKLPVKLYIPYKINFTLDQSLFADIAEQVYTLIIKDWDPFPKNGGISDFNFGSPFEEMINLRLLDIAFDKEASFQKITKTLFKGLDSLEALLLENLPYGSIDQPEILETPVNCLGLINYVTPCSCDKADPGHWLHRWLHKHSRISGRHGRDIVYYSDRHTSSGDFFLCEAKVSCSVSLEAESVKIIPMHEFHWSQECDPSTIPVQSTTTDQSRYDRFGQNVLDTTAAKNRHIVRAGQLRDAEADALDRGYPFAAAVRSSAAALVGSLATMVLLTAVTSAFFVELSA